MLFMDLSAAFITIIPHKLVSKLDNLGHGSIYLFMVYLMGTDTEHIDKLRTAIRCKYHSVYSGW